MQSLLWRLTRFPVSGFARNFHLWPSYSAGVCGMEITQWSPSPPEAEAVCRHCLVFQETIKIWKFTSHAWPVCFTVGLSDIWGEGLSPRLTPPLLPWCFLSVNILSRTSSECPRRIAVFDVSQQFDDDDQRQAGF